MSLHFDLELPRRDFLLKIKGDFEKKTVGIFGPSGAGKTSFFQMLCGLEKPARGRIILNGRLLTDMGKGIFIPPQKRMIGMVFQEKLLFPHLNVKKNLLFGARYHKQASRSFDDIIELLELRKLLESMPAAISGGEQQRVAIGRALLTAPELLLLDEPFTAVDTALKKNILPYLRRVKDELNVPMLVISHNLSDIRYLTDNIYLMEKGKCTGFGSIYDLIEDNIEFARNTRLVNTLELTSPRQHDGGLYICLLKGAGSCRIKTPVVSESDSFFLFLYPDEISLSLNRISGISIQNQIPGSIKKIVQLTGSVYCVVDIGMPLIVKVSIDAMRDMQLKQGMSVFCLFKANSLHSYNRLF